MSAEARSSFACFGGECTVAVTGHGALGTAERAVTAARTRLLAWHDQFTRFDEYSELTRLNADGRDVVEVTPLMGRFVAAAADAARATGGLVDASLLSAIENAGYRGDPGAPVPLAQALHTAPPRRPAAARPDTPWSSVSVTGRGRSVRRPAGLGFDSGGLAKGMFADVLAQALRTHEAYAVVCGGDLRIGGAAGLPRDVRVASPFDGSVLHTFGVAAQAAATSGIGRRSWVDARGRPAHHLLDPSTGRPAFTGVVQATALAPTALQAEVRAKAAVLSGPERAADWLDDGGVLVLDDGGHVVVAESLHGDSSVREHTFAWEQPPSSTPTSTRSSHRSSSATTPGSAAAR